VEVGGGWWGILSPTFNSKKRTMRESIKGFLSSKAVKGIQKKGNPHRQIKLDRIIISQRWKNLEEVQRG